MIVDFFVAAVCGLERWRYLGGLQRSQTAATGATARAPPANFSPALALRAPLLRFATVAHPGLHICLSLGICAIARVFAPPLPPSSFRLLSLS
jgi:hypothetical protein